MRRIPTAGLTTGASYDSMPACMHVSGCFGGACVRMALLSSGPPVVESGAKGSVETHAVVPAGAARAEALMRCCGRQRDSQIIAQPAHVSG